jgi:uncharacterized protein YjfI (DUF2170 family)
MEGPISFWGYKEQESNLILAEHDDDDIARWNGILCKNFEHLFPLKRFGFKNTGQQKFYVNDYLSQ